jgi:MtN3 and saliva related transmembrane protein
VDIACVIIIPAWLEIRQFNWKIGSKILGWKQILGMVAGALIAVSFIPQIWKLFKLKSVREINLPFTLMQLLGGLLFLVYGIVLSLLVLIITNIANITIAGLILFTKFK